MSSGEILWHSNKWFLPFVLVILLLAAFMRWQQTKSISILLLSGASLLMLVGHLTQDLALTSLAGATSEILPSGGIKVHMHPGLWDISNTSFVLCYLAAAAGGIGIILGGRLKRPHKASLN